MHIPGATYRLQFGPSFKFEDADKIVDYLFELGITDIYASPVFQAKSGHGYDVTDPNLISSQLGGYDGLIALVNKFKERRIHWIQDIVPNHMSFSSDNKMLMDVFEKGTVSEYFSFFDIDWLHVYPSMNGRVLAPFLGQFYAEALESKNLVLKFSHSGLSINYYELSLPIKLGSYYRVFSKNMTELEKKLAAEPQRFEEFKTTIQTFMPEAHSPAESMLKAKHRLWDIYENDKKIAEHVDDIIGSLNGRISDWKSFVELDQLLADQMFRLSFWKVAAEEINYRRFFTINELICLRIEDISVFEHTHQLVFKLVSDKTISGLRIDHIDGLYDPTHYLGRLKDKLGDFYIIAEKILVGKEELPEFWPIQGTTGYDFLNYANGIFCRPENEKVFNRIYNKFTAIKESYEELACQKKRLIIGKHLAGNIDNLALYIKKASSQSRYGTDITLYALKRALVELFTHFPVYRTYINKDYFCNIDKQIITETVQKSRNARPDLFYELNFIEKFLLLDSKHSFHNLETEELIEFTMMFQQVTSPLMAKGIEDTMFYTYNRFLAANEVGSHPNKFGCYAKSFHGFNKTKSEKWPNTLNALSTHDTKRGEDFRARLNVLSEIPEEWEQNIKHWHKLNRKHKVPKGSLRCPDKNDEYFLYQTLAGSFPFSGEEFGPYFERLKQYLIKSVREAKVHTAWIKPDADYENAYIRFAERILDFNKPNQFIEQFLPFVKKISGYGIFNSLAQVLLKITSPGVPDLYQGTELWDFSFVDPDNRRPVDFGLRKTYLKDIIENSKKPGDDLIRLIRWLMDKKEDGRIKLFLTYQALNARKQNLEIFQKGTYAALETGGRFKDNIFAFARILGERIAVTVVPRFLTAVSKEDDCPLGNNVWEDTYIAVPFDNNHGWTSLITGQKLAAAKTLPAGQIFNDFPAGLIYNR